MHEDRMLTRIVPTSIINFHIILLLYYLLTTTLTTYNAVYYSMMMTVFLSAVYQKQGYILQQTNFLAA